MMIIIIINHFIIIVIKFITIIKWYIYICIYIYRHLLQFIWLHRDLAIRNTLRRFPRLGCCLFVTCAVHRGPTHKITRLQHGTFCVAMYKPYSLRAMWPWWMTQPLLTAEQILWLKVDSLVLCHNTLANIKGVDIEEQVVWGETQTGIMQGCIRSM